MHRKKRVRVVVVCTVALLSLFMALFGAPLIAMALWPIPEMSNDTEAFLATFSQAAKVARAATTISLVSLVIAGGCVVYLLVVLAGWFIGSEKTSPQSVS